MVYITKERIYVNAAGERCEPDDPNVAFMLAAPGARLTDAVARQADLLEEQGYADKTRAELVEIADARGLEGVTSRTTKGDLIALLEADDAEEDEDEDEEPADDDDDGDDADDDDDSGSGD